MKNQDAMSEKFERKWGEISKKKKKICRSWSGKTVDIIY